jgi:RNA polymerase sigma-70 factor (ECF subfamily)
MSGDDSAVPESGDAAVQRAIERGELDRAAEQAIRLYGPEITSWLRASFANEADAYDAFSRMSEQLWRSLGRFDGRCSLRTWCYMLAHDAARYVRGRSQRRREVLVSQVPSLLGAVTHVWNTTRGAEHRAQDVYAEIRRALDDEDRTLLVMRVDRKLAWRDIAIVLLGEGADPADVTRKAATLRKQFERVKIRLRELAAERLQR